MLLKHPDIITPNGNTIIWRYMGIEKFFHLLTHKQLFFSRLSRMTDKYEGSLPDEIIIKRIKQISKDQIGDPFEIILKERREIEKFRDYTFLNCWTINRNESYALWKIYLKGSSSGIAIRSTVSKLRKSIESIKDNHNFYMGEVNYKEEIEDYPPKQFQLTTTKKPYYEFENELRVFYYYDPEVEKNNPIFSEINGWYVDVDISELIERIYISPFTGVWFHKSFKEVIQKINPELVSIITSSKIQDE